MVSRLRSRKSCKKEGIARLVRGNRTQMVKRHLSNAATSCLTSLWPWPKLPFPTSGVSDGMRCLYSPDQAVGYAAAWDICTGQGAVSAPVLTSYEHYRLNTTYAAKTPLGAVWLASNRVGPVEYPSTGGSCVRPYNRTYIFKSATDYDPLLAHSNTWFRTRNCLNEDPYPDGPCQILWLTYTKFVDAPCTMAARPMCQLTNPGQNYVRVKDVCLDEVAIVEKAGTKPEDCAGACNTNFWCRSFNFGNGKCQLFPWHVDDGPKMVFKSSSCAYYVYLS